MNKTGLKALALMILVCFVLPWIWKATEPKTYEPIDTGSEIIQWKEPEVSIEPSTFEPVAEPETEDVPVTEIPTENESETEQPITYYCKWLDRHFTEEEFALICTTTFCESGGESSATQKMVALTILNQIGSGKFGDSVREVIYKKNNFSVTQWKDFEERGWTSKVEQSVLKAMEKNEHPRDMFYFRTDHFHRFGNPYKRVGNVYFSTEGR